MKHNSPYFIEAKTNYDKLTKGIINFFSVSKDSLKSFYEDQTKYNAYTKFDLGFQNVPLNQILGSLQKNTDFNKDFIPVNPIVEARWCNIYCIYMEGAHLPLVQLFKIKDTYYVSDGNHRVSVAKHLNFSTLEADVTEFLPNTGTEEDITYSENFFFKRQTDLKEIEVSFVGGYPLLVHEIVKYGVSLKKEKEDFKSLALDWKKNIFNPVTKIAIATGIFETIPNGNIFLKVISRMQLNQNLGYLETLFNILDYPNVFITENIKRQFRRLEKYDYLFSKDFLIEYKLNVLEKFVGISFKTPLKLIEEIETLQIIDGESFSKQDLFNLRLKKWHDEKFIYRYSLIENKIFALPEKYKKCWFKIDNSEKINLDFIHYKKIFISKFSYEPTEMELVLNYMLEIYIPIIELISKRDHVDRLYYMISNKYMELYKYKKKNSVIEATNLILSKNSYLSSYNSHAFL